MGLGARAQAVYAHALVGFDRLRPEQRGQFTCGTAPHQVHFEITFLRVNTAERPQRISLVAGGDGDHPQRIALHGDLAGQPGQRALAVQLGQAAAQQQPQDQHREQHDRDQRTQNPPPRTTHCRSFPSMSADCSRRRNCD
ncbi:hypothetical protein D3C73_1048580 [compost metagenome]